jgi:hypothetical protein
MQERTRDGNQVKYAVRIQPYLADLLRRSLFPLSSCTVKIAAIEQGSKFMLPMEQRDYLGIEL